MKKIAFILNPISGTHHKKAILEYVRSVFSNNGGYSPVFYTTKCAGDALRITKEFVNDNFDIVVAIGGDGTVNEVASALVGCNTALGIIPVGSGNGLARHLKISLNYKKAVENILNGHIDVIDAGKVNDKIFFCTAGIGYEANIGKIFNSLGHRGLFAYMETCTQVYFSYHPEKYKIDIKGNIYEKEAFSVTFANCAQWGNNTFIAPNAGIKDGLMDVVVWKKTPFFTMPFLTAGLFLKAINYSEYIETYKCKELTIIRENEGLIQFDGDSVIMGKILKISILHEAVRVICGSSLK